MEFDFEDDPRELDGTALDETGFDDSGFDDTGLDDTGLEESTLDSAPEASYACWACGEEIVVPIDPTMGHRQEYVEDCPVCCRPNLIHVEVDPEDGYVRCWNERSE